jgi:hypothetical protein
MRKYGIVMTLAAFGLLLSRCHKAGNFAESDYDARLSGGEATVFDESSRA